MNNPVRLKLGLDKLMTGSQAKISAADLVRTYDLKADSTLPLVIEKNVEGVSLPIWLANNRGLVEEQLLRHGAILFRAFEVRSQDDFEQFLQATDIQLSHYLESATPRTQLSAKVYTSTEFPPSHTIGLHNELSYVSTFPLKIWFCCLEAAEQGGETPIADVRRVFQRIAPNIRELFARKGWMLVRNFGNGMGPTWQNSFHVESKAEAEDYFRRARIDFVWKDETQLRTAQVRPAIAIHPKTGESLWFNHIAFWHVSSLEPCVREAMLSVLGEDELPYNTYYGDGSPIEGSVIAEIRAAYEKETVAFPWRGGDILMLDNMLTAHGRRRFAGARRVLVSMGEPYERKDD